MNPNIALLINIIVAFFFIKIVSKEDTPPSKSIIIPLLWFMFMVSKSPTFWLDPNSSIALSADTVMDGNSTNRLVYTTLTIAGIIILARRQIAWDILLKNNFWIIILYIYYTLSIAWSDFPDITFKRILRDIGNPIMLFILATDKNPLVSIKYLFKWCTYLFIPLSIVYFKYYPSIGRLYHRWSGEVSITGVAGNKNGLGVICLLCGFYLVWEIILLIKNRKTQEIPKSKIFIMLSYLTMVFWILITANSATSLMSLIIAIAILLAMEIPLIRENLNNVGIFTVLFLIIFTFLQIYFNIFGVTVAALGRDPTLTGRTDLWEECLKMGTNPILGVGYENFWVGQRYSYFLNLFWWHPNQSHNGYLETYLEQGVIGLLLLIGFLFATFKKISQELIISFDYGKMRMALFCVALIYNITEASMKSLQPMWFVILMFYIVDSNFNNGYTSTETDKRTTF